MTKRAKSIETKKKILDAAAMVFSKKGYHSTTIAEICQLARVNIASINYHFGDKESLYIETWKSAFQYAVEKHPPVGDVNKKAPVEMRLKRWIVSMLNRVTDPACVDIDIANIELTNSTGLLTEIINTTLEQAFRPLGDLIREILGEAAKEEDIQLCIISIISQCTNPLFFKMRKEKDFSPLTHLNIDLEKIAEHVIRFSFGGLERVKLDIACQSPKADREA